MDIVYKGEPPAEEPLRDIVMMFAGPAPAQCKHPVRKGRVKGSEISALSTCHDVRLSRVGDVLHLWPSPILLADAKKSALPLIAQTLRETVEAKRTTIDQELAKSFSERAESIGNYWSRLSNHERRHFKQAGHCQKIGSGGGYKLSSGYSFQKDGRQQDIERGKLKAEQRKANLADKEWRKKHGGKVNRDKRPPMHGGRFKPKEGAVDDEGVGSLSELARVPSTVPPPLPEDEDTAQSENSK